MLVTPDDVERLEPAPVGRRRLQAERLHLGGDVGLGQLVAAAGGTAPLQQVVGQEAHVGAQQLRPDGLGGGLLGRGDGRGLVAGGGGRARTRRRQGVRIHGGSSQISDRGSIPVHGRTARLRRLRPHPRRRLRHGLGDGPGRRAPGAPTWRCEPFLIARTPVTHAQYAPFLEDAAAPPPPWWTDPAFDDPDQPVVGITWFEACRVRGMAGRAARRFVAASHGGGMGARGPRRPGRRAHRLGRRASRKARCPRGRSHGPWRAGRGTPNALRPSRHGHHRARVVPRLVLGRLLRGERRSATRAARRRASGAPAAAGPGAITCAGRRPRARSSLPPEFRYADYGFRVVKLPRRPA